MFIHIKVPMEKGGRRTIEAAFNAATGVASMYGIFF
jgi:hypothetical protein